MELDLELFERNLLKNHVTNKLKKYCNQHTTMNLNKDKVKSLKVYTLISQLVLYVWV